MPRRELLTAAQRAQLFAFPAGEDDLIRLATLFPADLAFIGQHRTDANRLGIAVLLAYLRFPGRALGPMERPHPPLLGLLAAQLDIPPSVWEAYASRDETRREHLQELLDWLGLTQISRGDYRAVSAALLPVAIQTTQGLVIAQAAVDELRRRRIVLPPVRALDKLCAAVATRAQRSVYRLLTGPLVPEHRTALDGLLGVREGHSSSTLAWVRQPPGAPSAKAVLAHLDRLAALRALALPADRPRSAPESPGAFGPGGRADGGLPARRVRAGTPPRHAGRHRPRQRGYPHRRDARAARPADRLLLHQGQAQI
jgi:hypothetical protein